MAVTPLNGVIDDEDVCTSTGVLEFVTELFPSWPLVFPPQHLTPPVEVNAHE
jgi:hypothetical protein